MRQAVFAGGLLAASAAVAQESIVLTIDQARVLRIARPATTVIIGNSAIADATIRDNQTLIITARSFGTTNLIVLDRDGQPIADEILTVQGPEQSIVTVFKRSARQTFSCAPTCEATVVVGDEADTFRTVQEQITGRAALAQGSAN